MRLKDIKDVIHGCEELLFKCRIDDSFAYKPFPEAVSDTLYSSAFAVMIFHYTGALEQFSESERAGWLTYLQSFQDQETGLFDAAELHDGIGVHHNLEHRRLHLTCHVLPALHLLKGEPKYPIRFTEKFLNEDYFTKWLAERDLAMAWVEGNNLFFAGQLLIYEMERTNRGEKSILMLFAWLREHIDEKTALWGTNLGCPLHKAMYGAYHQLILYFYLNKPVPYLEKLIDSVLDCQHFDGGFSQWRGGGTCQDIDGIDILVNCYKISPYRRRDIRKALRRSLIHIMRDRAISSGGFQDRKGQEFIHNSMPLTKTPIGTPNTFSTWFTLHALIDIGSVLSYDSFFKGHSDFRFNKSCSMGWGYSSASTEAYSSLEEKLDNAIFRMQWLAVLAYDYLQVLRKK